MASAGYSIEGMKCTFSPLLDLLCCKVFRGAETVHISGALHFLVNQKEHIQFSLDEIFYPSGEASAKDARNSGSVSRSEGSMDKTHQTASRKEHSNARSILDTAPSFVSQAASSTVDVSEVDSDVVIKTEQGTIVDSFSFLEAADDMDTEAICSWQTVQEASTSGHRVSDVEGDQMESDKQGAESPDEENPGIRQTSLTHSKTRPSSTLSNLLKYRTGTAAKTRRLREGSVDNFHVPWNSMPQDVMEFLEAGERLPQKQRGKLVRETMDEVLRVCRYPTRRDLMKVADAVVRAYPDSFADKVGDFVLGTGHECLLKQLVDRRDNVNRNMDKQTFNMLKRAHTPQQWRQRKQPSPELYRSCDQTGGHAIPSSSSSGYQLPLVVPETSSHRLLDSSLDNFQVPWDNMPLDLMNVLEAGERPMQKQRAKLVRKTMDEVLKVCRHPTKRDLIKVADSIVSRYPNSFADKVGDTILGTGHETLLKQLLDRRDNMNRNPDVQSFKRKHTPEDRKPKKKRPSDSYGCVNWQPPLPANTRECNKQQKFMQEMMQGNLAELDMDRLCEALQITYSVQRQMINGGAPLQEIMEDWPFLFTTCGMLKHFELLVGIPSDTLIESLKEKGSLLAFLRMQGLKNKSMHQACERFNQAVEKKDNSAVLPGIIWLVMLYFKEDVNTLLRVTEETAESSDVAASGLDLPASPCVVVCGSDLLSGRKFMLAIDGRIVLEDTGSFGNALTVLFASYYIFNRQYPAEAATTLEFLQRCLMKINMDGSKTSAKDNLGKGKAHNIYRKVFSLIHELAEFEWTNNSTSGMSEDTE